MHLGDYMSSKLDTGTYVGDTLTPDVGLMTPCNWQTCTIDMDGPSTPVIMNGALTMPYSRRGAYMLIRVHGRRIEIQVRRYHECHLLNRTRAKTYPTSFFYPGYQRNNEGTQA